MKKYLTELNIVFAVGISTVILVTFGFLPREASFVVLVLYAGFILRAPMVNGVNIFLRSIPFFIALPITESFDNFNMWRILLLLLFVKWAISKNRWMSFFTPLKNKKTLVSFIKTNRLEVLGIAYLTIAAFTIYVAPDVALALKRLIYIVNAVFLFVIIRSLIIHDSKKAVSFMKNFSYSAIAVVVLGFMQFFVAYFAPAWIFHYWWGQIVSVNMFGAGWGDIVTNFGNTWFSYSGATLRLRMFSIFPDSHSFPMYVIMALPALLTVIFLSTKVLWPFVEKKVSKKEYMNALTSFSVWYAVVSVSFIMLALILSGTRGIWVSVLIVPPVIFFLWVTKTGRHLLVPLIALFLIFMIMFPVYLGILSFPQFQDTSFTTSASFDRIRSIIDFGETSNQGRIYIWKKTVEFIAGSPLWGIGVGNYPLILTEPLSASRAGSSAHNLYLHIGATIGLIGLAAALLFMAELVRMSLKFIKKHPQSIFSLYFAVFLFSFAWVALYSMTDAALFDGRALLAFMTMSAIAVGIVRHRN